jgi:predicted DNA-binding transcriptional regulator YafY
MSTTSSRTLRLLSLLQHRRDWTGPELADRLEVSERTVRRDVERLRSLGYPVEATRGVDGGYRLAAGAALPPLVLDDDEAVALVVGLRASARSAVAGVAEASVVALAKVVDVLPARLKRRADALAGVTVAAPWAGDGELVDPDVLTTLALAARAGERVIFEHTSRDGDTIEREVEPHELVLLGRRWYLAAYDLLRHDWRTFRLDRIRAPRSTGRRYVPKAIPHGDALAFVQASVESSAPTLTVDACVHAPAADVAQRIGRWGSVTPLDAAACRVRMEADQLQWPLMALATLDADVSDVSPPEFAALLERVGRRFVAATAAAR